MTVCKTDIFHVEAKAIFVGLRLAQDKGFRQFEVKSDNTFLTEIIQIGLATVSNVAEV